MTQLPSLLDELAASYGEPAAPAVTDPFEQILWENVVYLTDEGRRQQAFDELRQAAGARPGEVLAAPDEKLLAISSGGILAEQRVAKVRFSAELTLEEFGGDLMAALRSMNPKAARRALRKYPGIGDPGADKILLFAGLEAVPSIESNGLRVLGRLGVVTDNGNYSQTYRAACEQLRAQLAPDFGPLIRAYQLLRRHGQETCRRAQPQCLGCPLSRECAYASSPP